jgi:hypothetical protein
VDNNKEKEAIEEETMRKRGEGKKEKNEKKMF